jgi:hypothetical protein
MTMRIVVTNGDATNVTTRVARITTLTKSADGTVRGSEIKLKPGASAELWVYDTQSFQVEEELVEEPTKVPA